MSLLKDVFNLDRLNRRSRIHLGLLVAAAVVAGVAWTKDGLDFLAGFREGLAGSAPADVAGQMIRVGPDVQGLRFGHWRLSEGQDRMGHKGTWLITTLTVAGDRPFRSLDLEATTYNKAGIKTHGGWVIAPDLKPGETGEIQVRIDDAYRVTISGRK
jgi:hypothetical protein